MNKSKSFNSSAGQFMSDNTCANSRERYSTFINKLHQKHNTVFTNDEEYVELAVGEGSLTVEYLLSMENQSEVQEFDHKADRAAKISSSYCRDKQKEKRKITAQINKLKKRADKLTLDLTRASKGMKMEHQADLSAFASDMSVYASSLSSWFAQKLIDPKCVGALLATMGYIETAYQSWDRKKIVLRIVLLYVERMYSQFAPPGTFRQWADFIVEQLGSKLNESINEVMQPMKDMHATFKAEYIARTCVPEDQAGFQEYMDTSKVVLTSDALTQFRKVSSLLVAVGFMSGKSTMLGMQVFSEKATEKCSSITDIFTIAISCIDYFVNAGRKYLESRDWMDLLYEDSLNSVTGRMSKIMLYKQNFVSEDVDMVEYQRFAEETVVFLKTKAKAENVIGQSAVLRHIAVVEEFIREIKVRRRGFMPKPAPIGMNIWGGSGLGKSSLCHFVCTAAAKALGFESFIGSTAAINDSTKHDDSMNSGVRCILVDDINYGKQECVEGMQGSMGMDVINNNVKFCAKADLDAKGAVIKCADFYVSTCNDERMFLRSFNMPEAFFRRIKSLQVKLKKEAQTVSGELDSAFAIRMMAPGLDGVPTRIPSEIWALTLKQFDFRTNAYVPLHFSDNPLKLSLDPFPGSIKLEDVDLPTVLVAIRHMVNDNAITQKKVVDFLSKPIPSCPHNDFEQLCPLCHVGLSVVPLPPPPPSPQSPPTLIRLPPISPAVVPVCPPSPVVDPLYAKQEAAMRMAESKSMVNQVGVCESMVDLAKQLKDKGVSIAAQAKDYNPKDYVHPGKVVRNCSAAVYDIIPSWMAASLVCKTHRIWAPILRAYFKYNAADKISVFRFKLLYAQIYLVVFLAVMPWIYLVANSATGLLSATVILSVMAYLFVCLIKNSIQHAFAAEIVRVQKNQWKDFMASSVDVTYNWRYYILGCITSLILAGLMLKSSFGSSMEQQAFEAPYEASCNWSEKKPAVQPKAVTKTATVEQLVNKLALHAAVLVASTEKGMLTCRACPYKNGTWITNVHFLEAIENLPLSLHSAGYTRQLRVSRKDWKVIRGDVALLMISCPTQPDLSGYITTDIPTGEFPAQWILKEGDGSAKIIDVRAGFVPPSGWGIIPGNKEPIIRVDLGFPSAPGMCGSILISVSPRTISIVGIHRAGFTGTPDVAIGAFNAFDVKQAFEKFSDRRMVPHISELELFGKSVTLGDDVPLKSCVNHLYDDDEDYTDRIVVLGSTDLGDKTEKLHGNTKRSPIFDEMKAEFGEPDTGPCKYNQPEWMSSQPALLNTTTSHLYDIPAFECAMAALEHFYMDAVDKGVYKGVVPYTIEEACQGVDCRPYVNGLNYNSSMGMPYNHSKMNHSFVADNGKRMLDPDIIEGVEYWLEQLKQPDSAARIFGEFKYKDEATKLVQGFDGRKVPKTARVYACYPVALQVIMAMVFGPFGEAQNYNPEAVGACVGYDMCSHDARAVAEQATLYSANEVIDGDYGHFDQSSTPEVTDRTMAVDIKIAKRIGYPEWAINVMTNIIILLTFPVMVVNGVAVIIPGMTTSGHGYTIHANNKICRFYIAYSFYQKIIREGIPQCDKTLEVEVCGKVMLVPDVFAISSFVTQGDDHIGSVRSGYRHLLNMQTLQEELAIVDIAYTDASKSVVNKKFDVMYSQLGRSLEELFEQVNAEFLKRRFVDIRMEVDGREIPAVACPIALRSILKSMYWKKSFELDHVWLEQVCHGAAREIFFYGEEVFDEFVSKMSAVVARAGVGTFTSPIASFETHMQKYVKTLSRSNSVRDCERVKFRGRIVLYGSMRMEFAPHLRDTAKYLFCVDGFDVESMNEFRWNDKFDVFPRVGVHLASLFRDDDERILQRSDRMVLVRHDEELDKVYLDSFPDITEDIKSSLYRVGSSKYLPPPRGR
jgi:hypothetical protein